VELKTRYLLSLMHATARRRRPACLTCAACCVC
jgi:hypothetical protein